MDRIRFVAVATLFSLPVLQVLALDTEAPELQAVRFVPAIVDVTDGPVQVRIEFDVTDDVSGFAAGRPGLVFGNTIFDLYVSGGDLLTGTPLDGTYVTTFIVPAGSPPGERTLEGTLWDNEGRRAGFTTDATLMVQNSGPYDSEPPTIHSITIEPKVIDLSNGPKTVTISIEVSDDVTGIVSLWAGIAPTDPSLNFIDGRSWRRFDFTEGNERRTLVLDIPMDEYTPAGEWQLTLENIVDRVRLPSPYNGKPARLVADFDATFEVINPNGDAIPPELISVQFLETVANTAYETSFLPWRVQFADLPSGIDQVSVYLYAPSGADNYIYSGKIYDELNVVDIYGDTLEGIIEVPRYIQEGQHRVQVLMRDVAGNLIKYGHFGSKPLPAGSTEFITVEESAGSDTTDILITDFSYSPNPIDVTNGPAFVTFQLDFEDDRSGLDQISLSIDDPAGDRFESASLNTDELLSGTPMAGTLFYSFEVPRYSPPGEYRIDSLRSRDQAGNYFSDATYPVFPVNLPSGFMVINDGPVETEPPEILSVNMPQTVIEINGASESIPITVQARDDLSGIDWLWIEYVLDGDSYDNDILFIMSTPRNVVKEQGLTLTFEDTALAHKFDVPGTYVLDEVWIDDNFGLRREYDVKDTASLPPGLPTEITVINSGPVDRDPPQFKDIRLSDTEFDVSQYPGSLTIEIDFTDDTSGLEYASIDLYNRDEYYRIGLLNTYSSSQDLNIVSGDQFQGTLKYIFEIPRYIPPGTYEVQYELEDMGFRSNSIDGNDSDFPFPDSGFIEITNSGSVDFADPLLRDLSITETVDVSDGPATADISVEVIDDLSGVGQITISTESPSGDESTIDINEPRSDDGSPIKEGRFPLTIDFRAFAEPGEWKLEVTLKDRNNGYKRYESVDLQRWGFPSTITVINNQPAGYLWKGSSAYPGGWRYVEWFGWAQDPDSYPYVYHAEHGWIYTSGSNLSSFSMYDFATDIWWSVNENWYPYMYANTSPPRWVYYYAPYGTPGNRWFYDFRDGTDKQEGSL